MHLKARLDKFWSYPAVKFHFTADLTGIGNRSEEVKNVIVFYNFIRKYCYGL